MGCSGCLEAGFLGSKILTFMWQEPASRVHPLPGLKPDPNLGQPPRRQSSSWIHGFLRAFGAPRWSVTGPWIQRRRKCCLRIGGWDPSGWTLPRKSVDLRSVGLFLEVVHRGVLHSSFHVTVGAVAQRRVDHFSSH